MPHLSYIGDADVGERSNLGASTITANYDGRRKHRTKVGKSAKTGIHTSLVAPVDVGDRAYTGAGSTITEDVPEGALGDGAGKAKEHRGLLGPRGGGLAMSTILETEAAVAPATSITAGYEKRLMITAGRASRELGGRIAERLGVELTDAGLKTFADGEVYCRYEESIRGADLFVVQSDLRLRARGPHGQRRALGAPPDDPRRQARLGAPDRRRHPVVRVLAPGQEVCAARADLRAPRRRGARDGGHRPPGRDGPPRGPAPGLLLQAGRPHDRDADPHPVRDRPPRRRATS